MNKEYCKKCGSKKVEVECHYFDEYTGARAKDIACPNEKCEAHCDFWGHDYKRQTWWHTDVVCKKCGYIPRDM